MRPYTADQRVENLGEYASGAVYKDFPNATQFTEGVEPRSTLPAKWWNWFQGKSTKNISLTAQALLDIYGELNNLFTRAGIAPGVSGDTSPQLNAVLQALLYANPDQSARIISTNKTIITTFALVDKFFVDTAGIIVTFPDITGESTVLYRHAELMNISSGSFTVEFVGASGLGNLVIPAGGKVSVYVVKKSDGTYCWRHDWHYRNASLAYTPVSRDSNSRFKAGAPLEGDDVARLADTYPKVGEVYIQYPGQSAPGSLFPNTVWVNISSSYPGAFFRAEGGAASSFGGGQQSAQNLTHSHSGTTGTESVDHSHSGNTGGISANHTHGVGMSDAGSHNHFDGGAHVPSDNPALWGRASVGTAADCYRTDSTSGTYNCYTSTGGSHSHPAWTGNVSSDHTHYITTGGRSAAHTHTITVGSEGGSDLRPINFTMRMWKRES